jgi:hypothetical protein
MTNSLRFRAIKASPAARVSYTSKDAAYLITKVSKLHRNEVFVVEIFQNNKIRFSVFQLEFSTGKVITLLQFTLTVLS